MVMKTLLGFFLTVLLWLSSGTLLWSEPLGRINPEGMTVETRFHPPEGYARKDRGAYVAYMRQLALKPEGSPVHLHTGELKGNQSVHLAVLDIDVGKRNLQNCSDAAQRLRAEFLYQSKAWDKIAYHLSNGFLLSWDEWRKGKRLLYDPERKGKAKTWLEVRAKANSDYPTFRRYLDALFTYAGVDSVMAESQVLALHEMEAGDVFASRGPLIIILDVVENDAGEKYFLLAQSFIPAQEIEVLISPDSPAGWYALSNVTFPFRTPEWIFPAPGPNLYRLP